MKSIEELGLTKQNIDEGQFYKYKDGSIFPYYKEDIKRKINVFKPDTFLPLLKELDVPFIPSEWFNKVKHQISKGNGDIANVFGQYISLMYLKAWRGFGFEDATYFTEFGPETQEMIEYKPKITLESKWKVDKDV